MEYRVPEHTRRPNGSLNVPQMYDVENASQFGASAQVSTAGIDRRKFIAQRGIKSKPWRCGWHWRRCVVSTLYVGLLATYALYIYYRIRYTLKTAKDPSNTATNAVYTISFYPIFALVVEVLCFAAMALYAVNKTYYPARTWQPPPPVSVRGPFRVAVCVCCYKEGSHTITRTLAAAATAIREARDVGLIAPGTAIWLLDDTPAAKPKSGGIPNLEGGGQVECSIAGSHTFVLEGVMRDNRVKLLEHLRWAYPDVAFVHRLPDAASRKAAVNGLNKKSGNLNSVLPVIWPSGRTVDDRDVMVVLDADQAAFADFLVKTLPCLDAGVETDEVALVQSPQVFEGVHPVYDIFNHQNVEFWSTMMVAYNSTGFISCAGTNFAVRATALSALGPAPFPTHTVTEDFAFGMRLRAHNPRFSGIYLPLQLVKGTAPDTIRAAFKQRSRWTKGPFQMLLSRESPFRFTTPEGAEAANRLSLRDRVCFFAPVFNTVVNCVCTPFFCFVPVFFIWTGRFPASLTLPSIIVGMVAWMLTFFFKYYTRPNVGVRTVVQVRGEAVMKGGEIQRRKHSLLSYILAEWNADVNIRFFWWMFAKVIINFFLRTFGCRRQAGFSATVGGEANLLDGFMDVLPLSMVWLLLTSSVVWGVLQLSLGARLLGPLGICIVWCIYQSVPFAALMFYVLFRVRHEPQKRGCCWCYEHVGRFIFTCLYLGSFLVSWACIVTAAVLAILTAATPPHQTAFTQHANTFTRADGQVVDYTYFYTISETVRLLRQRY